MLTLPSPPQKKTTNKQKCDTHPRQIFGPPPKKKKNSTANKTLNPIGVGSAIFRMQVAEGCDLQPAFLRGELNCIITWFRILIDKQKLKTWNKQWYLVFKND